MVCWPWTRIINIHFVSVNFKARFLRNSRKYMARRYGFFIFFVCPLKIPLGSNAHIFHFSFSFSFVDPVYWPLKNAWAKAHELFSLPNKKTFIMVQSKKKIVKAKATVAAGATWRIRDIFYIFLLVVFLLSFLLSKFLDILYIYLFIFLLTVTQRKVCSQEHFSTDEPTYPCRGNKSASRVPHTMIKRRKPATKNQKQRHRMNKRHLYWTVSVFTDFEWKKSKRIAQATPC